MTLDIVDLKPGMEIDEFMKQGVTTAEVVFLVGTPDYLRRVPEPSNEVGPGELGLGEESKGRRGR